MTKDVHELTFDLDGGHLWKVRIKCPTDGSCPVTWSEKTCDCRCAYCEAADHYVCEVHEDDNNLVGPGCSIEPDARCGMQGWFGEVGSDLIVGEGITVLATLMWSPGEEYPAIIVTPREVR